MVDRDDFSMELTRKSRLRVSLALLALLSAFIGVHRRFHIL